MKTRLSIIFDLRIIQRLVSTHADDCCGIEDRRRNLVGSLAGYSNWLRSNIAHNRAADDLRRRGVSQSAGGLWGRDELFPRAVRQLGNEERYPAARPSPNGERGAARSLRPSRGPVD